MRAASPWLTALLQTAILFTVVASATPWLEAEERPLPIPRRSNDVVLRGLPARPIFNGSVVPGGVYSAREVRAAIERDGVVATHYRDLDLSAMQATTLTAGKAAYVSYRVGDRIFWTRHRVWLKAGETVLTDGTTTIRARCGNCVSDVKQAAVAETEPGPGELDDFVVPPTPDTGVDAFAAEAETDLGELLQVPFAAQTLATLLPASVIVVPDVLPGGFPGVVVPPVIVPGGSGGVPFVPPGGGGPGSLTTGGTGSVTSGSTSGTTDGSTPTTSTGTPSTGTPPTGTTTGTPIDVPPVTTGTVTTGAVTTGSVTTGPTTGFVTTGSSTTGTTGVTDGSVTDGTPVFPTTTGTDTGVTKAPEPETLWLVAVGVIGVASRRLRRR